MKFEIDYYNKLAQIVNENNLSELTLQDGDKMITIKKENGVATIPQVSVPQAPVSYEVEDDVVSEVKVEAKKQGVAIKSPMVGSFYKAPSPDAQPFVKVGDTVAVGQVVCIIEAMKLMNEIESEVSGKVTQICVEDGQSVEYGQVLMYVE